MMIFYSKLGFAVAFMFSLTLRASAQKSPLDNSCPDNWPAIKATKISDGGKYILYTVGSKNAGYDAIVQPVDCSWKMKLASGKNGYLTNNAFFIKDSDSVVFRNDEDSLSIVDLTNKKFNYINCHVSSFKINENGEGRYLVYLLSNETKDLIFRNLSTNEEKIYRYVDEYILSDDGRVLSMITSDSSVVPGNRSLKLLFTKTGKLMTIGQGLNINSLTLDKKSLKLVYLTQKKNRKCNVELWYWAIGMDTAINLAKEGTSGMEGLVVASRTPVFDKSGSKLFFYTQNKTVIKQPGIAHTYTDVDVWNYKDPYLQSEQLNQLNRKDMLATVIWLKDINKVIPLGRNDGSSVIPLETNNDSIGIVGIRIRNTDLKYKKIAARQDIYVVDFRNGSRKSIKEKCIISDLSISVDGGYAIWYDKERVKWEVYNVSQATVKCISDKIHHVSLNIESDAGKFTHSAGIAGWLANDEAVLVYDRNDIWKVDPRGETLPLNITCGYGKRNGLVFRLSDLKHPQGLPINSLSPILLSTFNSGNKQHGFFTLQMNNEKAPKKLSMGPYASEINSSNGNLARTGYDVLPIKARNAEVYILQRMTTSEYPNLQITTDFTEFKMLTELHPEREYNWFTSELVKWKLPNGNLGEGILYKPEDFNPQKKYPVIFYYYEKASPQMNMYVGPELSDGCLNIAWYVSNGYEVFVPDFNFKIGQPGKTVLETVVSAAYYLSKHHSTDLQRMGLQGHSFAGWETNYIVSKTSLFAAACSAAGYANLISEYGAQNGGGSKHEFYEATQGRIGATLWEQPDLYLKNSPIFDADKVKTPLLIVHNKGDEQVDWKLAFEWFTALNSLNKKVWMLQYDNESHVIDNIANRLDFSIRLSQFFGHYLKDLPAPAWMTKGIPASRKGLDTGLQLDPGAEP